MSLLKVDQITPVGGLGSGAVGGIIQVVSTTKTNTFSSSSTDTSITGLSVTITPQSSSSTFLILVSFGRASTRQSNLDHTCHLRIMRQIGSGSFVETTSLNGEASGSRLPGFGTIGGIAFNDDHSFGPWASVGCDSPNSTSAVQYKMQFRSQVNGQNVVVNQNSAPGGSSLILMEIEA